MRTPNAFGGVECLCGRCDCLTTWRREQLGSARLDELRCPVCGVIGWMHLIRVDLIECWPAYAPTWGAR